MLLRRRRHETSGTEKVDYARISHLEIECGLEEAPPDPVAQLMSTTYERAVSYFLMSTDPSRPVLKHMWDDA